MLIVSLSSSYEVEKSALYTWIETHFVMFNISSLAEFLPKLG